MWWKRFQQDVGHRRAAAAARRDFSRAEIKRDARVRCRQSVLRTEGLTLEQPRAFCCLLVPELLRMPLALAELFCSVTEARSLFLRKARAESLTRLCNLKS